MDTLRDLAVQFASPLQRAFTPDSSDRVNPRVLMAAFFVCTISWFVLEGIAKCLLQQRQRQFDSAEQQKKFAKARSQLASGACAALHASVVTVWVAWLWFDPAVQSLRKENALYGHVPGSEFLFTFMCSYFAYDIIICVVDIKNWGVGFLLHAVLCWAAYWLPLGSMPFLQYYGLFFAGYEGSTPLLHVRALMIAEGRTDTMSFKVVNYAFCTAFVFFRFIIGWPASWGWWMRMLSGWNAGEVHSRGVCLVYFISNILLNTLNIGWFMKLGLRILSQRRPKRE